MVVGCNARRSWSLELALMALVMSTLFAIFDIFIIDWLIIQPGGPCRLVYPAPKTARAGATTASTSKSNSGHARLLCLFLSSANWVGGQLADLSALLRR